MPKGHELPPPTLQNVVATANLNQKLNLRNIAQWCRNAEYNPKRFSAVIMRIREPRTTALIFSTGRIVITGAKSEQAVMLAARIFEKAVQKVLDGEAEEKIGDQQERDQQDSKCTDLVPRVKLDELQI